MSSACRLHLKCTDVHFHSNSKPSLAAQHCLKFESSHKLTVPVGNLLGQFFSHVMSATVVGQQMFTQQAAEALRQEGHVACTCWNRRSDVSQHISFFKVKLKVNVTLSISLYPSVLRLDSSFVPSPLHLPMTRTHPLPQRVIRFSPLLLPPLRPSTSPSHSPTDAHFSPPGFKHAAGNI